MRRSSKRLPRDPKELAAEIVRLSVEDGSSMERSPVSEYLAKIGSAGGRKGGPARAKKLSASRKRQIARKAAKARWKSKTKA